MAYEKIKLLDIEKIDVINTKGMTAAQIYEKYKPDYILNGALYDVDTGTNIVKLKDNGVSSGYLFADQGIGIMDNNKPVWCEINSNVKDYIAGAPTLVINGISAIDWGNKYSEYVDGNHKRSVLGFNGTHLYLLASDYDNTIQGLASYCAQHGMTHAINLDGGGSCHLQKGKTIIKKSTRSNASWIIVYLKKSNPVTSDIDIKIDLIPKGFKRRPGTINNQTSITIHNTGCPNVPADNFRRSCLDKSQDKEVSWHYTVDEKEIVQHIPDNEVAWHCGNKDGNYSSIAIEICERDGAEENAIKLIRHSMKKYNISIDKVVSHKSWSGKQCPHLILPRWDKFINSIIEPNNKIKIELNGVVKQVEAINKDGHNYIKLRDLADSKIEVDYKDIPIVKVKG